ncbi:MAG: hypothetical protein JXJ18_10790, partial [Rhodobacteraceae bacterium]|nr:hypothetical protein [Paracoccaceae bacterium]
MNAAEALSTTFRVNLANTGAVAGDRVELLLDGRPFGTATTETLNAADITNGSVDFTLAQADLGANGPKSLTARLLDEAGNASTASAATSFRLDTSAPTFQAATIKDTTLTLRYDQALDHAKLPDATDFTITIDGRAQEPEAYRITRADGNYLIITLETALTPASVVTVAYADPTTGDDANAIQDAAGNDVATLATVTANYDGDGDGISDADEGGERDGNGDGIADSQQTAVTAIKTASDDFVTLENASGGQQSNVAVSPAPTDEELPQELQGSQFPLGVLSFDIADVAVGGTEVISLYVDSDKIVNGYIKQDKNGNWVSVPITLYEQLADGRWSEVAPGTQVSSATQRIDFAVQDGGPLDLDPRDGYIKDPGAPVFLNHPPVFTGGDTLNLSIAENTTAVARVQATDADPNDSVSLTLSGEDAALFRLRDGRLTFKSAPDYENPQDQGDSAGNNTYVVMILAEDQNGGSATQTITVSVTDVPDTPTGTSYFDDEFVATQGANFNGGPGRDMLFVEGALSDSTITRGTPTATVVHGAETETLSSVEVLLFGGAVFDEAYYLDANPDVAAAVIDGQTSAFAHYIHFGHGEGRTPNVEGRLPEVTLTNTAFDPIGLDAAYYLEENPDVTAAIEAGILSDARQHFDLFGRSEGRDPNALFDTDWYLEHNPDVAAAVATGALSAYDHYLAFGGFEGRNASDSFASALYLSDNPDVAAAGVNPLLHFLAFGVE